MLETIVKTDADIKTSVSSTDIDPLIADRLSYIGELYKQIAQIDFSKPVLEALLNYKEPEAIEDNEAAIRDKKSRFVGIVEKEIVERCVTYRPTRSYTNKADYIKEMMDAYDHQNNTNASMSRIMKGITYRTASLMYNFMNIQMVKSPVNLMYYLKHTGKECSVSSTVTELKTRNIFSSIDTSNFHNEYEDTIIDACSEEFERYIINEVVRLSHHMDTTITAHSSTSRDDIMRIVAFFHKEFINITDKECDYIILNNRMYANLVEYTSKSDVPMLFGKPVFRSGADNAVTFGINPNTTRDYISGFPIFMTNMLVNSQTVINPTTFSPTLWVASRHTIEYVGDSHKSIITFKCWDK